MIGYIYYLTDDSGIPRYVGKTIKPLEIRLKKHLCDKDRTHKTNWINNVGKENIKIILIEECDELELNNREIFYINDFKSKYKITNGTDGGDGIIGLKHSDATKIKMSESAKGRKASYETKKLLSKIRTGKKLKPLTDEAKKKISEANKGRKHTQDEIDKISLGNKGKIVSDETRIKLSISLKGKKLSEEHIKKLSDSHKGKIPANKGKKMSEEQKLKISNTLKGKIYKK